MSTIYKGPSKDASYKVSLHLSKRFRGDDFQKSTNQKQELPVAAMFYNRSELNKQSLQMTFQGCFLLYFESFRKVVSEKNIFQKSTNQKQELLLVAIFVNKQEDNDQSLLRTSKDASNHVSVDLVKRLQRRFFRNQPIRTKNSMWRPCL